MFFCTDQSFSLHKTWIKDTLIAVLSQNVLSVAKETKKFLYETNKDWVTFTGVTQKKEKYLCQTLQYSIGKTLINLDVDNFLWL